jgi:tRNA dimethylallyltransferase
MSSPVSIDKPVLALVGPTAIGKTALSLLLAERFNGEIISVDSMQVYRFMDIGTAKVSPEERARIPHHLIDIVDPDAEHDAASFVHDALLAIGDIHQRGKVPILTGGTGLYLRSLIDGLFSEIGHFLEIRDKLQQRLLLEGSNKLHEELSLIDRSSSLRISANDTHRLLRALEIYHGTGKPWSEHIADHQLQRKTRFSNLLQIGLTCDRKLLYQRIDLRTRLMLQAGLEEEVRYLLDRGYKPELKSMQSIGYRHMNNYINKVWELAETERILARDTRHYAKRQYTWFNNIADLLWIDIQNQDSIIGKIDQWIS